MFHVKQLLLNIVYIYNVVLNIIYYIIKYIFDYNINNFQLKVILIIFSLNNAKNYNI